MPSFAQMVDDKIREFNHLPPSKRYAWGRTAKALTKARRWLQACGIEVTGVKVKQWP